MARRELWLDHLTRVWRFELGADWLGVILKLLKAQLESNFSPSLDLRFQVGFSLQDESNWAKSCNYRHPQCVCHDIILMVPQRLKLVRSSMCGQEMSDITVGDTAPLEKNVSGISDLLDAIWMLIGKEIDWMEFIIVDWRRRSKKTAFPRPMNLGIWVFVSLNNRCGLVDQCNLLEIESQGILWPIQGDLLETKVPIRKGLADMYV